MSREPESALASRVEQHSSRFDAQEIRELDKVIAEYESSEAPKISDFSKTRTDTEGMQKDQDKLDRLHAIFKPENKFEHLGKALEMVLMDFASSWLPGYISKASEYDDFLNKTDLVLEMEDENNHILRIALDVTANSQKAGQKIWDIVKSLRSGGLSTLKYFKSQLDASQDIKYVPRVVAGSDDLEQTRQLIRLYLSYRRYEDPVQRIRIRKAIANHPIGADILEQILFQLQRTASILHSADAPQDDLDQKIAYVKATISELERYKKENAVPEQSSTDSQDRNSVLEAIKQAFMTA